MAAPNKVDWVAAQKFYLENPTVSVAQVADQYGVSEKVAQAKATKEGWVERRKNIAEESIGAIEGEIIQQNRDRNDVHGVGARNLQGLIQKKMDIAYEYIKKLEKELPEGEVLNPYDKGIISDKGLSELSNAFITAVNLERVTLNLPTSVERKEITGQNGKDLFGDGDNAKLNGLIVGAISALAERRKDTDSQPSS